MREPQKDSAGFIDPKSAAPERLPQLELALDNAAALASDRMARYFAAPSMMLFSGVEATQVWEALARARNGVVAALQAVAWDARIAMTFEAHALDLAIEAMLGGEDESGAGHERARTAFDLRVAGALFEAMAEALRGAFAPMAETDFVIENLSATASPDMLFRRDGMALLASYDLRLPVGDARLCVVIPVASLAAVRPRLARVAESAPPDPAWLAGLRARLGGADVRVQAILDERVMSLGEIATLSVGALLPLRADAIARLALVCDGAPLFQGELGQAGGVYTVRVTAGGDAQDASADAMSEGGNP